ncbi:MAG: Na+/H+ antiporter [Actinobacteria bacterium]|nr:MAG: Na+/H+ antiporter [Actinomycetota bacterium]
MHLDVQQSIVALSLLAAVAAMLALAPTLRIPFPILLVLGGLAIGLVPGMPNVELNPKLIFFGVLPPLLYGAAFFTSLRDLRANKRTIGLLAFGLVIATTLGVAVIAHTFVDGLTWQSAFVLGAIVSPTDPIAATAIAERLGVPRKLVAIVEGESLVNDGTGLVLYRVAVLAVVAGSFSFVHTSGLFVVTAAGGVAVGLAVGWVVRQVRRRLDNPPAEVTISLLTGYFAFFPAEMIGVSAVLAAVSAGIYLGWYTPELTNAQVRLQGVAVWEIVQYLLNALLFVLVGLQLPVVVDALGQIPNARLLSYAALVSGTVIVVRFGWVFAVINAPKWIARRMSSWRGAVFLSWAGMRGALSLAAALALPLETDSGGPFPGRDLILFLTFAVILVTLVGQGLTLPFVIRVLGLEDDGMDAREEAKARIRAAEAALARLEELVEEDWVRDDTAERMRGMYRFRTDRFHARFDDGDDGAIEARSQDYQRLRRELLDAERDAVLGLRRAGTISDDVWYRVARDLDLEDQRLDI